MDLDVEEWLHKEEANNYKYLVTIYRTGSANVGEAVPGNEYVLTNEAFVPFVNKYLKKECAVVGLSPFTINESDERTTRRGTYTISCLMQCGLAFEQHLTEKGKKEQATLKGLKRVAIMLRDVGQSQPRIYIYHENNSTSDIENYLVRARTREDAIAHLYRAIPKLKQQWLHMDPDNLAYGIADSLLGPVAPGKKSFIDVLVSYGYDEQSATETIQQWERALNSGRVVIINKTNGCKGEIV